MYTTQDLRTRANALRDMAPNSGPITALEVTAEHLEWAAAEIERLDTRKGLIEALRLGESACLGALVLDPISANHAGWKNAAERIRQERLRLEAAAH